MKKLLFYIFFVTHILLTAEVIWENFYNPFNADGINVRSHMQICSDGGYAITGYYIIEDGMGGYLEWCGYVMKISSEGELLWADKDTLSFPTSPTHESNAIIETSDGGLINGGDGYMIKRDANGNRLWTQDLDIAPTTMCYSQDGNIVLSGSGPAGACLFRIINEDGNEILNNDFSLGLYSTTSKRIIPTSDGGYALTGRITDEVSDSDIFVCKTDADGDTLWTYRKDGCGDSDVGRWIIENSENQLLCVGDIYPEPLTIRGYFAKFELDGYLHQEEILSPENGYNCWYAIDLPTENSFLITAVPNIVKIDYDFNIVWVEYMNTLLPYYQKLPNGYIFYSNGAHLIKWEGELVGIQEEIISLQNKKLNCYPNPFNPTTTIKFELPSNITNPTLEIFNIKGQLVESFTLNENQNSLQWNAEDHSSGIYLYHIKGDNQIFATSKMVLLK